MRLTRTIRGHWLFCLLLVAGLVLRIMTQLAYQPALLYIDSKKYLFGLEVQLWGAFDPLGYTLMVLRPVLLVANLAFVAALQHAAGIGMAIVLYLLLPRLGVNKWLAAIATAPVLLDGYQLVAEQTIMPDVMFEALVVAGIAVLLWRPRLGLGAVAAAGPILGLSAPVRQIGEALLLPALAYVLVASSGWRTRLLRGAVLTAGFAAPILLYMTYAAVSLHDGFELSNLGDEYLYGRAAHAADCGTLRLPTDEWFLCPSPEAAAALGVDGLVNSGLPRDQAYVPGAPLPGPGASYGKLQQDFAYRVLAQQPLRVAGDIAGDAVKLFALTRDGSPGDTPISRWQFQDSYPYYPPGITATGATSADVIFALRGGGGPARASRPLATALRAYQQNGGYTPGPILAIALLAGGAGIVAWRRPGQRRLAFACLLITTSAIVLLLGADFYEFSWRYQLPALITLPAAGVMGATALAPALARRYQRHPATPPMAQEERVLDAG